MTEVFIPQTPLHTAVLFLVFNRPDTTAMVFEAIRNAKPPRLYVAADGPRRGKDGEAERVEQVRQIATAVDWPCTINTLFREHNLGCKYAVSSAISWFFDNEEQGIILEDDCLPSQSFFWLCEKCLEFYKHDESIFSVSGSIRGAQPPYTDKLIFKSNYFNMWGWASWRRVWKLYDVEYFKKGKVQCLTESLFKDQSVLRFWKNIHKKMEAGAINTWDYQMMFLIFERKGYTIYPVTNLVTNIGFGVDATHCKDIHHMSSSVQHGDLIIGNNDSEFFNIPIINDIFEVEYRVQPILNRTKDKLKRVFLKLNRFLKI
jgi:hypothetical protein